MVQMLQQQQDEPTNGYTPSFEGTKNGQCPEPIAVIGFSMQLPGGVNTSDALWKLMLEKRSTVSPFPQDRINLDSVYHPDVNRRGQIPIRQSHFLKQDIANFDPAFFGISTTDAAIMDPQQRLLLESTYTALENAGVPMEQLSGSKTSVYTGSFCTDWTHLAYKDGEQSPKATALGIAAAVNANRISWFFNLAGNSVNVDTACSSSLVCLDLGCKGLMSHEEDMSIVAGCNVIISPDTIHSLTNLNMLSPDGQCYSFDHRANGYGRGEGVGVLILKRVTDAIRDHDTIRGIIRNTGCNHCGHTTSISLPNRIAQEALIRDCYTRAGLSMQPTRFFEAHGTGTQVGDPIEARAIGSTFRDVRSHDDPLWVGAMKSNVGHLEGGSGIAGVIKSLLVLEKAVIPPNSNFEKANPNVDSEFLKIKFPLECIPWPSKGLRRASVNSFGNSGTNAHVILDDVHHFLEAHGLHAAHHTIKDPPFLSKLESDITPPVTNGSYETTNCAHVSDTRPRLLLLSANDAKGSHRAADDLANHYSRIHESKISDSKHLDDLVYTLAVKRSSLPWKSYAILQRAQDLDSLSTRLTSAQKALANPNLGFVFTGQGAQWPGMARELMVFPVFQRSLSRSAEFLIEMGCTWQMQEEILKEKDSLISAPDRSQPICTAVQIALLDLLESFKVRPVAVIGHSSGEIAAAYCTKAISHKSAIQIAYYRGYLADRIVQFSGSRGTMMAVGLSEKDVMPYIKKVASISGRQDLVVACINSPKNVTVSGPEDLVQLLRIELEQAEVFVRRLRVDVAYHSPQMKAIAEDYLTMIKNIGGDVNSRSSVVMLSSVTGGRISTEQAAQPDYWVSNLVSPVRFYDALRSLLAGSAKKTRKKLDLSHRDKFQIDMILEIGPHSALQAPISDTITEFPEALRIKYASLLVRNHAADLSVLHAVGQMQCLGYPVDVESVNGHSSKPGSYTTLSDLPSYNFDHSMRYWSESRLSLRYRTQQYGKLDLLGKPVLDWSNAEPRWRNFLRLSEMPWMEDHVINGVCIYPGAGMLTMAIEAANQLAAFESGVLGFEMRDISFQKSLAIPQESSGAETQLLILPGRNDSKTLSSWSQWRLFVCEHDKWIECCSGLIRIRYETPPNGVNNSMYGLGDYMVKKAVLDEHTRSCHNKLDVTAFYRTINQSGLGLHSSFQRIRAGSFDDMNQVVCTVTPYEWPQSHFPQTHVVHPITLDCLFHSGLVGLAQGGAKSIPTLIPTSLRSLYISRIGLSHPSVKEIPVDVKLTPRGKHADLTGFALDFGSENILVHFEGLQSTNIADQSQQMMANDSEASQSAYHIEHFPDPALLDRSDVLKLYRSLSLPSDGQLTHYLDLLARKASGLRIVAVNGTNDLISDQIRDVLHTDENQDIQSNVKIRELLILNSPGHSDELSDTKKTLNPFTVYQDADYRQSLVKQNVHEQFYDVVMAPAVLAHDSEVLKNLKQIMKPDGKLVLLSDSGTKAHHSDCSNGNIGNTPLIEAGFQMPALELTISHAEDVERRVADIYEISNDTRSREINHDVYIVTNMEASSRSIADDRIVSALASFGITNIRFIGLEESFTITTYRPSTFIIMMEMICPVLYSMTQKTFMAVKKLLTTAKSIMWVNVAGGSEAGRPEYSIINGVARVLRNEYTELQLTIMSFEQTDGDGLSKGQINDLIKVLDRNHIRPGSEAEDIEYVEIDGFLNISRTVFAKSVTQDLQRRTSTHLRGNTSVDKCPPLVLTMDSPGALETLHFIEDDSAMAPIGSEDVEVQVSAIGINFKDCLIALDRLRGAQMGQECVGVVTRAGSATNFCEGDRVVVTHGHLFKTVVRAKAHAVFRLPSELPSEVAACITVQFGTAWVAIHRLARMERGESILIHSGASGTGQAAIQIAQKLEGDIYTTVSSQEKKQLLMNEYHIPENNIFYSRDTSFEAGIRRATRGRGVDVIINSLADDLLLATWDCIASHGRFVEIGKKNITANSSLPMLAFEKNASFHGLDAAYLFYEKRVESRSDMDRLIRMFADKSLRPAQPMHIRDIGEVSDVFKTLQTGNKPGKTVLTITPESQVFTSLRVQPSFAIGENASYIISGGFGGIGRASARFLAARGARCLIILSRSGPKSRSAQDLLAELKSKGVQVHTPQCDITDLDTVKEILGGLMEVVPPVRGCIQCALVGRDSLFEHMTYEDWQAATNCKTIGSWNLHTVLPRGMDFFVMLSSGSGLVGVKGQANYDAGNVYEDALSRYRVAHGEKAATLDLGAMIDDGILAEDTTLLNRVLAYGSLEPVTRQKYFAMLDYLCDPSRPLLTPTESQIAVGLGTGGGDGLERFDYSRQPMLQPLERIHERQEAAAAASSQTRSNQSDSSKTLIAASRSFEETAQIVADAIQNKLARSLMNMRDAAADMDKPLQLQGVDSLLAIELRNWIAKEFAADVAVFEVQGASTLGTLSILVAVRTTIKHPAWSHLGH